MGLTPVVGSTGLGPVLCELGNSGAAFLSLKPAHAVRFNFWCEWEGGPEKAATIRTLISQRMLDVSGRVGAESTVKGRLVLSRGVWKTVKLTVFMCLVPFPAKADLAMKRMKPRESMLILVC